MNIFLYLHGNINQKEKFYELLNIAGLWKKTLCKSKIFIVMSEKIWKDLKEELKKWDIDKSFLLEKDNDDFPENTFLFLKEILEQEKIDAVFMGNSLFERELAPYTSSKLNLKFIPNVINFEISDSETLWKKFLYGTKAVEERKTENKNLVVTFSSNIYKKDEKIKNKKDIETEIIRNELKKELPFEIISSKKKVLQKHPLETARIVIGVGKGIKGKENFPMIEELAEILGATIGATRSVVDNGWRPEYEKIGQTGKIIKPELYLGFGISGAMQHMAGVQQSRHIIMVNSNPNAESFRSSDFGIVADLFEVVPKLIELLKK